MLNDVRDEIQGRIQDFVKGRANPADISNTAVISAKMTLLSWLWFNTCFFLNHLHMLKQAKNQSGIVQKTRQKHWAVFLLHWKSIDSHANYFCVL